VLNKLENPYRARNCKLVIIFTRPNKKNFHPWWLINQQREFRDIAPVGHLWAHTPHDWQFLSSITARLSCSSQASKGQTLTHKPQAIQAFLQTFLAFFPLSKEEQTTR
jgi:hypothetical protein